ncbi:acyl-[acyl-carrier-protein] thioesterase [Lactiplantibacillus fabifermentans]|uniref:Oleoyl-[acyl-carrier protein] thioesterase n=1 Tax=Lactiplantibacillus fabifermentans DSM 21115 TaxID=1413187 RepID=A0A0R2NE07_9LACO|nr:acyl-ACP thioesterase domain-containing protein [Lactiplantibacillus fabifermentans]KRO24056.1 oleoyl-[acyl-carrier protein] thioesterase [Lactiplantibacillus fabifermentans DSM 21115]
MELGEQASIFTEKHRMLYYECDRTGRATLATLIDIAVLASQDQSDALGLTTDFVQSHGVGWVVTQYAMDITRMPHLDETVTIAVRGSAYNPYFAFREFWIRDENDQELAYITSIWVTMSQTTRKIVKLDEELVTPYHSEAVKRIPRLPRPISFETTDATISKPYQVRFFDIDPNRHVNNAHYFDWLLDTLPADFLLQHDLLHVDVRYENEVQYGHTVTSSVNVLPGEQADQVITSHRIAVGDDKCCEVTIKWQTLATPHD